MSESGGSSRLETSWMARSLETEPSTASRMRIGTSSHLILAGMPIGLIGRTARSRVRPDGAASIGGSACLPDGEKLAHLTSDLDVLPRRDHERADWRPGGA